MHLDAVVVLPLQLPQQLVVALAPVEGLKVALQGQLLLVASAAKIVLLLCRVNHYSKLRGFLFSDYNLSKRRSRPFSFEESFVNLVT